MPIRKNMKHTGRKGKEKTVPTAFLPKENPEMVLSVPELPAEKLLRQDSVRAMEDHAAVIIHELKGPMQALTAQMQVMQALLHKEGNTRHDQRFSLIYAEIDRLSMLLSQYLNLGRENDHPGEALHLPTLALETAQLLRSLCLKQGATLEVEDTVEFPVLLGDELSIRRILSNLIINAAQAQVEPGHHIRISFAFTKDTLSMTVENDGPPITCQPIEKIFQPRYTTKPNGTGLGLFASRMLAKEYGGDLTVSSNPRRTAFTLTLPREKQEKEAPSESIKPQKKQEIRQIS